MYFRRSGLVGLVVLTHAWLFSDVYVRKSGRFIKKGWVLQEGDL